jgi:pyrimidine 5'-nucleotidase
MKESSGEDFDDATDRLNREMLINRTSLNATERICLVTADNQVLPTAALRADMRLHNLWHRATYVLIVVAQDGVDSETQHHRSKSLDDTYVLVQQRSALKDYCPLKLDPLPGGVVQFGESYRDNAIRELEEEMGIDTSTPLGNTLTRLFSFPYQDEQVRVWGEVFECIYRGRVEDLILQKEEVESILRMSLRELKDRVDYRPGDFMPDACYGIKLYFQRLGDMQVKRRLLKGYSSGNLDRYQLRPKPRVVFFDCDDCLYFDGWKTANQLTKRIDDWCVRHGLEQGQAYQLYKKHGTALRGLLAEGYIEKTDDAIDAFLQDVHDIPVHDLLQPDQGLREMLLRMDPTIPKFIFTASVKEHAVRCLQALGIADLFVDIIDCKTCNQETKHSRHSFETAMRVAGVDEPERCIFLDDNLKNIEAARQMGWRSILVGKVGRDCGMPVSSDDAENEIERIHFVPHVLPELFDSSTDHTSRTKIHIEHE